MKRQPTQEELAAALVLLEPTMEAMRAEMVGTRLTREAGEVGAARLNRRVAALVRAGELADLAWPGVAVVINVIERAIRLEWAPVPRAASDARMPALRTPEDRQLMAESLVETMREALRPHGPPGMPVGHMPINLGLSLYAALRVEYPSMTIEEACEAAAATVGAMYRVEPAPPSGRHRG